jgi:recombination protein RecR
MFTGLPGIGKKSATRIAHYILKKEQSYAEALARQLVLVKETIRACTECGNYTEENPCPVCTDPGRDRTVMCVVEQPQDVQTIEDTNEFNGLFHVLGGAISPIDGIGPKELTFDKLKVRVGNGDIREIIIATNPTVEGDTTALYIVKLFSESGITITRLASGIPVGGDLEYADRITLARSLKGRVPYSF